MDADQFTKFLELQKDMFTQLVNQMAKPKETMPSTQESNASGIVVSSTNTALLPNFESFDSKKESFRNYKQRFENYAEMKNVLDNTEYCAKLLLNSVGIHNFNMLAALAAPKKPAELKYDEIMNMLEVHLAPKKNVLVAQHQFLSLYQTDGQSIADFVATLRGHIGDCEFISPCDCKVSLADIFLRAQFIRGLTDNTIREVLLQSDISDFKSIVSKAVALEVSKIDSRLLSQKSVPVPTPDINKIAFNKKNDNNVRARSQHRVQQRHRSQSRGYSKSKLDYTELGLDGICLRCGKNHLSKECRIEKSNLRCSECKKRGHVAKVCIRTLLNKNTGAKQFNKGVQHIVDIYHTNSSSHIQDKYLALIEIEGTPIQFEIDTGSGFTFIPRNQFAKLNRNIPLESTNIGFRSYTQDIFVPDGKALVTASYEGTTIRDEIYIVPEDCDAILGRGWIRQLKIDLNEINPLHSIGLSELPINSINNVDDIVNCFPDIFEERIGCVPNFEITLKLREGATPIFHRERSVPYALRSRVDKELDSLEAAGIIIKADTSDWGSPLVVIPKADGGVRLCVDYKIGVNKLLVNSHYPIRKIDEILNSLRNSKYFCRLDLYKAYLHIPVDDKSSEIQTITTHRGIYRMKRLSFGIKTAPSEFNRIIDQILRDIPKTEYYFDDILVHGATKEECQSNLIACLQQLQKFDLHLNRQKCSLFKESIEFLGHVVEFNRILKSPTKIKSILEMPRPKTTDEVRRFLGLVTYYSRFIRNASTLTAPLRKLLNKNAKFKWTASCESSFLQLKQEISSEKTLTPYDPSLPLQLACDASPVGIAGILSHIVEGEERPISFASRSLTKAERNYSQLDREALAIVFAVEHFHQYLFARPFKLVTDNRPLARIFHQHANIPQMTSARLQRYAAFLSGFQYEVAFKKGCDNTNVDCLSRAPLYSKQLNNSINEEVHQLCVASISQISSPQLTYESIQEETRKDENLAKLLETLKNDSAIDPEFTIDNDILFKGSRVVIPASLKTAVLQELHRTHIGVTKMKQLARRYVYWKSIDKDIEQLVKACAECASCKSNPPKAPLHPWEEPEYNWQRIHVDFAGPFQGYYFLVVIDAKSKWAEIEFNTSAPTSSSTIDMFQNIFARNGFPDVMVSDNASVFTSDQTQNFCKDAGVFQKFIAPGHPSTNGLAERNIQTLKHRLASMASEPQHMRKKIREILFRYRATPLANGETPAERYFQRPFRIKLDALKPPKFQKSTAPRRRARQLFLGDRVQARYYGSNKADWKLGTIIKKMGQLHYLIKLDNGFVFKRHIDQLRKTSIPKKSVTFAPQTENDESPHNPPEYSPLSDLVQLPNVLQPESPQGSQSSPLTEQPFRRSTRSRQPPAYLQDYVLS